jgi:uncharacterized membrane protein
VVGDNVMKLARDTCPLAAGGVLQQRVLDDAVFVTDPVWHARLQKLAPMTAGLAIQATRGLDELPIRPWPGLGVLAAYAGAAMVLGAIVFQLRDTG